MDKAMTGLMIQELKKHIKEKAICPFNILPEQNMGSMWRLSQ